MSITENTVKSVEALKSFVDLLPQNYMRLSKENKFDLLVKLGKDNEGLSLLKNSRLSLAELDQFKRKHPAQAQKLVEFYDSMLPLPSKFKKKPAYNYFQNFEDSIELLRNWNVRSVLNLLNPNNASNAKEYMALLLSFDDAEWDIEKGPLIDEIQQRVGIQGLANIYVTAMIYGVIPSYEDEQIIYKRLKDATTPQRISQHAQRSLTQVSPFDSAIKVANKNLGIDRFVDPLKSFFIKLKNNDTTLNFSELEITLKGIQEFSEEVNADLLVPTLIYIFNIIKESDNFQLTIADLLKIRALDESFGRAKLTQQEGYLMTTLDSALTSLNQSTPLPGCSLKKLPKLLPNESPEEVFLNPFSSLLPLSNESYIRSGNQLFYVNKAKKEVKEITLNKQKLEQFDTHMRPNNQEATLSLEKLKQLTQITGHRASLSGRKYNKDIKEVEYNEDFELKYTRDFILRTEANSYIKKIDQAHNYLQPIITQGNSNHKMNNQEVAALRNIDNALVKARRDIAFCLPHPDQLTIQFLGHKTSQIRDVIQANTSPVKDEQPGGLFSKILNFISNLFPKKPSPFFGVISKVYADIGDQPAKDRYAILDKKLKQIRAQRQAAIEKSDTPQNENESPSPDNSMKK